MAENPHDNINRKKKRKAIQDEKVHPKIGCIYNYHISSMCGGLALERRETNLIKFLLLFLSLSFHFLFLTMKSYIEVNVFGIS